MFQWAFEFMWLIPTLPLLSFIFIITLFWRQPKASAWTGLLGVGISFLLSVFAFVGKLIDPQALEYSIQWLGMTDLRVEMGILLDPMGAMMLVVVTLVAFLVQLYSMGYMHGDKGFSRFYAYLSLFTFSMLGLVVANNYLQLFVFWEIMGLCSYLLVGFWYFKPSAAEAAKKAFVTTRVGDFGFLIGIVLIYSIFGTFNFNELEQQIPQIRELSILTLAALLIFIGAIGKSAQFPLHVWLPDAMEGPTPVSALIHAATMVAAGVFLVARSFVLFNTTLPIALEAVAYIGGISALLAATIAIVQNDIKRILAYSTLSQLGYMMMALGVGSLTAGMFHLMTHAFFKALLFLGVGSVIHALHEKQNIWEMGGLRKSMPITYKTMLIATLAIAGIPPLAGFWSKDEILAATLNSQHMVLFVLGSFVAFLTAFYMFRLFFLVFHGKEKAEDHIHESPASMTVPLMVLAVLSVVTGFWGVPGLEKGIGYYIHFGNTHHGGANIAVMLISTILAALGALLAYLIYVKKILSADNISQRFSPIYKILYNKYYFDEFYGLFTRYIWDGISRLSNWYDRKIVDGIVDGTADLTVWLGKKLRLTQTGQMQTYALVFFVAVAIFISIMAITEPPLIQIVTGGGE